MTTQLIKRHNYLSHTVQINPAKIVLVSLGEVGQGGKGKRQSLYPKLWRRVDEKQYSEQCLPTTAQRRILMVSVSTGRDAPKC